METQMAGSISRLDGNMSQDAVFKDILAYKEVLAHIMKTCVVEYRDRTIPEIMSYIENEPEVGQSGSIRTRQIRQGSRGWPRKAAAQQKLGWSTMCDFPPLPQVRMGKSA